MTVFHVAADSTDSATLGMCTTYLGACLLEALEKLGAVAEGPPRLVRLNPNVPWKTRGNGAVCVRCRAPDALQPRMVETATALTEALSVLSDPQTNPGLAVLRGDVPAALTEFYHRALHRIVPLEEALARGGEAGAFLRGWKNRRGIIGALAAIGADLSGGRTWEVIAYREAPRRGTKRTVDAHSVAEACRRRPTTFFNVGPDGRLLCVPRAPCPVLFGLRGVDPADAIAAAAEVISEPVERWVLWETNQQSDAHIEAVPDGRALAPFMSVTLDGAVATRPEFRRGGHLYFSIRDAAGGELPCVAYRPMRAFRHALAALAPGDAITVWAAVRPADATHPMVLNLEKVRVRKCVALVATANPLCPHCGGRMESLGRGQGARCKKCRQRARSLEKARTPQARAIAPGFIEPPPTAWRHLYRPVVMPPPGPCSCPPPYWGFGAPR